MVASVVKRLILRSSIKRIKSLTIYCVSVPKVALGEIQAHAKFLIEQNIKCLYNSKQIFQQQFSLFQSKGFACA
ncbi:hypothetical protein TSAR_012304 [Trichomalopsis sarcophagae]|uniref:Uncharacterized protein n=1 Tax=Trichomalopsis sarcophagae TaxID=543379 RepID=A0A232FNG3_9HYME|nr:hypothetical protein TSAR_012304 [Trichomalopsis sarcophagae]